MAIGRGKRVDGRQLLLARYKSVVGDANVVESGGVVSGPCPSHVDGKPSMRIFLDAHGKSWAKCYSGCDEAEILGALGLRWQDVRGGGNTQPVQQQHETEIDAFDVSAFMMAATGERLCELAGILRMPVESLQRLGVGWSEEREAWVFVESWPTGEPLTVLYRKRDGSKLAEKGRPRGLYIPAVQHAGDTLWVAEGASDLCALLSIGLPAIARHAALVSDLKIRHIIEYATGRFSRIVVVGDYDPKPSGKWPGRDGAVSAVNRMVAAGWPSGACGWVLPPGGCKCKDVRDWWIGADASERCGDWFASNVAINNADNSAVGQFDLPQPENRAEMQLRRGAEKFLVEGMFVEREPLFLIGVAKSLKTTLMIDLAVSLTTGTPFLGQFVVSGGCRKVLIFSGESGVVTLANLIDRVSRYKQVDSFANELLMVSFASPQLSREKSLEAMRRILDAERPDVVVIDPLYTALFSGRDNLSASSVSDVGSVLNGFVNVVNAVGATPVVVHHMKKSGGVNAQPNIFDAAMAGVVEYMRQWLLIGRTREYVSGSKRHDLKVVFGGARGYEGQFDLTVSEELTADGSFSYSTVIDDDSPADDVNGAVGGVVEDVITGVKALGGFVTLRRLREVCNLKDLTHLVDCGVRDGKLEWRDGVVPCGAGTRLVRGVGIVE